MNHIPDQDLLLLSHRSLGLWSSLKAQIHLRNCARCRARYAEFAAVSMAVASAVRPGLKAWHPLGLTAGTKLIVAVVLLAGSAAVGKLYVDLRPMPQPTVAAQQSVVMCKERPEKAPPHDTPPLPGCKTQPTVK